MFVSTPWGTDLLAGFTFIPAPIISSFSPTSTASGATLIITGTDFTNATSVSFGGTAATSFTVNSSTQISAVVASGASGNVSVTTPGGTDLLAGFTFIPAPTISSFSPTSGASGATVIITGTDFTDATSVSFGGTAATSFNVDSPTQISATVASGTSGNVSVTTPGGADLLAGFTFIPAPIVSSFSPSSGASGAIVIITGTDFTDATSVSFGGTAATSFNVDSPTQISATVASGTSGNVSVTTPGGADLLAGFTFIPAPIVSSFSPSSGASGAIVIITGTDFSGATGVTFGGTAAASFTVNSSTQISAVVASGSSGDVSVTSPGGTGVLSGFSLLPLPVIGSLVPGSGAVGAIVTINGDNFNTTASHNLVQFNGTTAVVSNSTPDGKKLTTTVPLGATTGPVTLTLNGVTVQSPSNFTVYPTPTLTEFSPLSGAPGAVVIITGTNFGPSPTVSFNGINATITSSNSTSIRTSVPSGAATGKISVTTRSVPIISTVDFIVVALPTISGFAPNTGAEGTTVTITGTNFSNTPSENIVSFNGTNASVTYSTDTNITTTVPVGATTGLISVRVSGVTVSTSSNFVVLETPTLSGFSPGNGAVGATIVISGTNFSGSPSVSFNGVAASVVSSNTTSITTVVPAGALTGPISIASSGLTITSSSNFTVLPTPTITGFSPTSGAIGATVTISGTNFTNTPGDHIVEFNNTASVVTASTSNSITTIVPVGASSGKISITVSGVKITSIDDFTISPTPSISGFTPNSGAVGATIILSGNNFSITPADNVIEFNGVAAVVTASTSNSITTTVPIGASDGTISLILNGVVATSGSSFNVLPTPTISLISPLIGSGAVGAVVTISGSNFSPSPIVSFNGTTAVVTSSTASSITTSVPSGASSGTISVTTSGVTITSSSTFTVLPTPSISGFTPSSGAVNATVIISGTHFSNTPSDHVVKFNNTTAVVTASNANSITTSVPAGATSGKISVKVSGVTVLSSNNFVVLSTPTITGFSPSSGSEGAIVIISGTNFNTTPSVAFNGIPATINSSTTTSINTTVPVNALTGPISIIVNGVTISSSTNFTVLDTPTFVEFDPLSGAIGTPVTISGTNFLTTPSVSFNGTPATVSSSTTTSIATSVPVGASSGQIEITVNEITLHSASSFSVLPTPSISNFTPASGAAGATVTINGNNFSASPTVLFNGVSATVVSSTSSSISVTVPSGTVTGKISVLASGITVLSSTNFNVLASPAITTLSSNEGAIGATVIISGTNFGTSPTPTVKFNGVTANVTSSNATSITTSVPDGASDGPISVTTSGITISSASNFNVLPTPTISGFSPTSGAVGAAVIISGTNFSTTPSDHVVKFNNTTAVITASTPTSITALVPVGASSGKISVTVSGITLLSSNNFSVLPSPSISSFSPTSAGSGATVVITGTNFISTPVVEFNGITAIVTSFTNTSITTSVPAGAGSGPISVSLSGITILSSSNFIVWGTPLISSFTPLTGGLGITVTITGNNFSSTPALNTVDFNGTTAVVTASTTTSITTSVPFGATAGPISVTVNGIIGTSSANFIVPTPTITSFIPNDGAVGASIVITGTNFSSTLANNIVEFFNGVAATVTAASSTSITATVPSGTSTGPISVTVNGITGTSSSNFNILPSPTITGFSPASGAVGATVTINGTNFSTNPTDQVVKFNNTTAMVTASTSTSITTTVPVGATTEKISVTISGVTITSAANFIVLPSPTISTFTATSGAEGAIVTITGTNFNTTPANNIVKFNSTTATVLASTTTTITASVPAVATTGKISVTVSGVTVSSASNFTVLSSPTVTSFTPVGGAVGTPVTITGTHFNTTPSVAFNGTLATLSSSTTTSIATSVPAGATSGPITVNVNGITIAIGSNFTVYPSPSITGFSPANGAVGAAIIITGSDFSTMPADNILHFNGVAAIVTASTATSITTTVPVGATSGKISLSLNGITIFSASNFTVSPTPSITGFNPTTGAESATVIISGTNFSTTPANNLVSFNGISAIVTASTSTSITTSVPPGATSGPVSITVSGITITSPSNFTIVGTHTISTITPASGAIGASVLITGTNFSTVPGDHVLKFNNTTALISLSTATSIVTSVPVGASTGKIKLTVNGVTVTSATDFTILPSPTITSISPLNGSAGATITISGTNFNPTITNNIVSFNGVVAQVISSTPTTITAIVPSGAATGPISVSVSGVTISSATNFTVLPTPTLNNFAPASGAVGATVTISGTNFSIIPANNVAMFNGTSATVTSSTSTNMTTTVPSGATTGKISLTLNNITLTSSSDFSVLPTPNIIDFSPLSGAAGATVIISGTDFSTTPSDHVVKFNEVTAEVKTSTPNSITAVVPVGASTGKITIKVSGLTITSSTNFIVMPTPQITNFSPGSGLVDASVTITGLNFDSDEVDDIVTFNGTVATVDAASTTSIITKVPDGATSGKISLTVNGVTIYSASDFTVLKLIPDDTTPPLLSVDNTPSEVIQGSNLFISAQFTDPETNILSAQVKVISPSSGTEINTSLTKSGDNFEFSVPSLLIGELGVQYEFKATNEKGLVYTSPLFLVNVRIPGTGLTIPYNSFGDNISNYRLISMPLDLDKPSVADVFDELPAYDKTKWRISHYDNATNTNQELLTTTPLEPGLGYWLLIKGNPLKPITTGTGKTVDIQAAYSISLKAGWNQIGNPYNFNLLWSDLVTANPGLPISFRSYNGSIKNFENKTTLNIMEGGFINVATDMQLVYPVKKNSTGRTQSIQHVLENSIDESDWEIDFTINQGDIANVIGGLGMRQNASEGFDIYDGFSMPNFSEFLDLNHKKKLNQYNYSKDVIPTTDSYTWNFKVDASNTESPARINWNNSYMGVNDINLILFDEQSNIWIDMKQHSYYSFTPPANFKVLYGSANYVEKEIGNGDVKILEVSPNPASGPISIHVFLPEWQKKFPLQLELKSITGITLANIFTGELESGYQKIEWSGESNSNKLPSGVYLIQMRSNNTIQTVRVILLN